MLLAAGGVAWEGSQLACPKGCTPPLRIARLRRAVNVTPSTMPSLRTAPLRRELPCSSSPSHWFGGHLSRLPRVPVRFGSLAGSSLLDTLGGAGEVAALETAIELATSLGIRGEGTAIV